MLFIVCVRVHEHGTYVLVPIYVRVRCTYAERKPTTSTMYMYICTCTYVHISLLPSTYSTIRGILCIMSLHVCTYLPMYGQGVLGSLDLGVEGFGGFGGEGGWAIQSSI